MNYAKQALLSNNLKKKNKNKNPSILIDRGIFLRLKTINLY